MMVFRLLFVGVFFGVVGASFVKVRNQHVMMGNEISAAEKKIDDQVREIEMWELRIAGVKDRNELSRRLRWVGSNLAEVDVERVIQIDPNDEFSKPVVGVF